MPGFPSSTRCLFQFSCFFVAVDFVVGPVGVVLGGFWDSSVPGKSLDRPFWRIARPVGNQVRRLSSSFRPIESRDSRRSTVSSASPRSCKRKPFLCRSRQEICRQPCGTGLAPRTARPMYRSLLVAGAVTCLAACGLSPNSPAPVQTPVTGRWSGTFESSWGTLPVNADLTNERGTLNISGNFTVDGQRASGTVNGMLETRDRYAGPLFWGSLTISYRTASGETCRSESVFDSTSGSGSENALFFSAQGFPKGNCPDPPTNVHISLRR